LTATAKEENRKRAETPGLELWDLDIMLDSLKHEKTPGERNTQLAATTAFERNSVFTKTTRARLISA